MFPKVSVDVPSTVDTPSRPPDAPEVAASVDVPSVDVAKTDLPAVDVTKVDTAGILPPVDTTVDFPAKAPGVEGEIKYPDVPNVPAVEVSVSAPEKPSVDAPAATDLTTKVEVPKVPTGVDVTTDIPSGGMLGAVKVTAPDVTVEGKVCSSSSFSWRIHW